MIIREVLFALLHQLAPLNILFETGMVETRERERVCVYSVL